jgi:hypothetical protein
MMKWVCSGFLVVSILLAQSSPTETVHSTAIAASADITGSYSPIGIDAGIVLSLSANYSFSADWWGLDVKSDKIIGGKVSGSWKEEEGKVTFSFDTKDQKDCVCEFRLGEVRGKQALIMTRPSEFPLSSVFGDTYYRAKTAATNSDGDATMPTLNKK